MEVRTCERCDAQHYASDPDAAKMRSFESDDASLIVEKHVCGKCAVELRGGL